MNDQELPTAALSRVVAPLEPSKAAIVAAQFGAMFTKIEAWQTEARGIVVTSPDEKWVMKRARELRLEIKEARVAIDKRRKEMKAGILLEGRAIDGAAAIFESLAVPLEKHLHEQETFAERLEEKRRHELGTLRAETLRALGSNLALVDALADLTEEQWETTLEDAKVAKAAREEQARLKAEADAEAARIVAEREAQRKAEAAKAEAERVAREIEQRAENERLRALAVESEKARAVERMASEKAQAAAKAQADADAKALRDAERARLAASRAAEDAAREKAEAQAEVERLEQEKAALARQQQEAAVRVAATKGPTKTRYAALVFVLNKIAAWGEGPDENSSQFDEPMSALAARRVLRQLGEADEPKAQAAE